MSLQPFTYPIGIHVRKHGPDGYPNYRKYRPWLRDEFAFRCVYCLWRETWAEEMHLDHFFPKKLYSKLVNEYDNLVYACKYCNRRKSLQLVPNPSDTAYSDCLAVQEDGSIKGKNRAGRALVKALGLATKKQKCRRALMIELARFIESNPQHPKCQTMLRRWFSYPSDLPSLQDVEVPKNFRPQGVFESHYARRNHLPPYY